MKNISSDKLSKLPENSKYVDLRIAILLIIAGTVIVGSVTRLLSRSESVRLYLKQSTTKRIDNEKKSRILHNHKNQFKKFNFNGDESYKRLDLNNVKKDSEDCN